MNKVVIGVSIACLIGTSMPIFPAEPMGNMGTGKTQSQKAEGTGTVKAVDAKAGKVTLQHGPIEALKWPAMTMGFKVADPKLLQGLEPGARVRFTFEQRGTDSVITAVSKAP